jgi:nucleoside 2-deoxyribosyltransferase
VSAIYLAARFSRIKEVRAYATRLKDLGHEITGRWIYRSGPNVENLESKEAERYAREDLSDVLRADTVILFSEAPRTPTRGGRMVEFGVALGTGKRVICVGGKENVFSALPQVEHFASFADLDRHLTNERRALLAA